MVEKVIKKVKQKGLKATAIFAVKRLVNIFLKGYYDKKHKKELNSILQKHKDKKIIIMPPLVDWNIPLYQRPQHLSKNLAKNGVLYFYCTNNGLYDNINGFKEIVNGCYLTNRFDLVDAIEQKKYYDINSTDNKTDWNFIKDRLDRGDKIIYQYIDEISENISGHSIPKEVYKKHINILKDSRCYVVPSATKLENEVKEYRDKNYKLITNGVEIEHFSKKIDPNEYSQIAKKLIAEGKPIIGYFGAFASWFDYELIIKLATKREDINILLLGVDYDGSIKKYNLDSYENITIAGPIEYKNLPKYASCFDVSIIPFVLNEITESTSPIKLFEYMAMGKPIVTTNMPECRKYKSVLIALNHNNFIEKIDKALKLKSNQEYLNILNKEANENSWEAKAKNLLELINSNE